MAYGDQQYNDKKLDEVARRVAHKGLLALEAEIGSANRDPRIIQSIAAAVDAVGGYVSDDGTCEERE